MKRTILHLAIVAVVAFSATAADAHGPQLQITNLNGRISTREIIGDGPYEPLTDAKSAYVMPVMELNGAWYTRPNTVLNDLSLPEFYSGPGLAYGLNQTFEVGSSLSLNFADGLKYWNGGAFVDAGATQLEAFRGSNTAPSATARTSDSAPFSAITLAALAADYDNEAHSTIRYRLLEEGINPNATSPDGIYLATLKVSSTQANLLPSDNFYFVLNKNAASNDLEAAMSSLNLPAGSIQVVPEPGTLAVALLSLAGLAMIRRKVA